MNSQEKKIIIGGVMITALASAGFSMSQGNIAAAADNYQSPPQIIKEKEEVEVVKQETKLEAEQEEATKENVDDKKYAPSTKPVQKPEEKPEETQESNPTQYNRY